MADERKELDWDLSVNVPSKGITRKLRVTSSESVQAIIYKVASKLGETTLHELMVFSQCLYMRLYCTLYRLVEILNCRFSLPPSLSR